MRFTDFLRRTSLHRFFVALAIVLIVIVAFWVAMYAIDRRILMARYGSPVNTDPCPTAGPSGGVGRADKTPLTYSVHRGSNGIDLLGGFDFVIGYRKNGRPYVASGTVTLLGKLADESATERTSSGDCLLN
jgi:hypothetical protein